MNKRLTAVSLVLGTGAALLFVFAHQRGYLFGSSSILVKSLPNTSGDDDDPWRHFELTVPPANPPLDMHLAFLVDGKGREIISEVNHASARPLPFKYRLDTIDDFRLEGALDAQGYHLKKNVVAYYFAGTAGAGFITGFNTTVRFKHEQGGSITLSPIKDNETLKVAIGEKFVLENRFLADKDFNGHFGPLPQSGPVIKTPAGIAHRIDVYVLFQPHQGPPANGTIEKDI